MNMLIVDDELSMRELLEIVFREEGFTVFSAESLQDAVTIFHDNPIDVLISDLKLGDGTGMELLQRVRQENPTTVFILITAYASADSAIDALKFGAYDYITKPFDVDELKILIRESLGKSTRVKGQEAPVAEDIEQPRLIGVSPSMLKIYKTIGVVAPTDSTILITGESGTGKEMIARVIHESSPRKDFPFVSINCGSFPETLLESELFGYQKGAFTGAVANKKGLFEEAHRGTLFLDEIAETSLTMQVKLLRAIQDRRIRRLGSTEEIPIDVRIIAATNKDLTERIKAGYFREDIYYRIAVIPVHLPPLRDRREDIPELSNYFLNRFKRKIGKSIKGFDAEAMKLLVNHEWKGNVRELENTIERAVALETTDWIQPERLSEDIRGFTPTSGSSPLSDVDISDDGLDLDQYLNTLERDIILKALKKAGGMQIKAALLLRIPYRSLRHRIQKLGISW